MGQVPVAKAESAFNLVYGGAFAEHADVFVEGGAVAAVDKVSVDEDESFLDVEADGDDIHGVLEGEFVAVFQG